MNRFKLNVMAVAVTLMGAASLAAPSRAAAYEELTPVCCPSSAGNCCGDECKASSSGGCSACSGWRCLFF